MKKFASLIVLVFALGLVFTSCAKKEEAVDPAAATSEVSKEDAAVTEAAKDAIKDAAPSKDAVKDAVKVMAKDAAAKKGMDKLTK
ncbi:MAG: hypothetical protein EHM32_04795 [Spirochaetales bacterium]|nr:MAG: hypothetical protein EHM32_04795 [Spirochaetales bacterium]